MACAIWQPVVMANDAVAGTPSSSASQPPTTSSATAAAGEATYMPAFWSHAEASQSAARAAGSAPPKTKPKNRGDWLAMSPGPAPATSASSTARGSDGASGNGPPSAARSAAGSVSAGPTRPSGRPSR